MKKGNTVLGVIAAITVVCWLMTPPIRNISSMNQFSQFLGALALVGFACANYISTRHHMFDSLFNGMDKAYIAHKWLGIAAIVLVVAHIVTLPASHTEGLSYTIQQESMYAANYDNTYPMDYDNRPAADYDSRLSRDYDSRNSMNAIAFYHIGYPSLILFVVLILIALLAKKTNYEKWKTIHKFMILPYVIGLVHYYGSSAYGAFSFSPFSIWLNIVNLTGLVSAAYSIFLYEKVAFPFRYKVSAVQTVSKGTVEITGRATGKSLTFRPGQFTFLKFSGKSIKFPSHPFTISGALGEGLIQFTVKNLGDHTARLTNAVKDGDEFAVTAPHGMFNYRQGGKHQIWIAGGIGVTPFRSFYLTDIPEDFSIDFFYAYHGEEEGVYLEEMRVLKKSNLRLHCVDDTEQGFLTVGRIEELINTENPVDIYFCGPKPMQDSLKKGLKNSAINVRGFHFEEFKFGR